MGGGTSLVNADTPADDLHEQLAFGKRADGGERMRRI